MIPYEKFNNSEFMFEDNISENDHLSSHITVSSTLLCQHLPKDSFVHHSHVNVLQSYHASLVKCLS